MKDIWFIVLLFTFIASSRVQKQLPMLLSRFGTIGKKMAAISEKYLESIGYRVLRDDPEHKPILITSQGAYGLEYGDLEHFMEVSEAYLKYTIDSTLKNREKI